jgi:hypothetical protein
MSLNRALFASCAVLSALQFTPAAAGEAVPAAVWHQMPFKIMAGTAPLDTIDVGGGGHAAPYLIDLDGDAKRDLVVGSIAGRFFFYKNIGSDTVPVFAAEPLSIQTGDQPAKVVNWCCMAAAPQFADIDGDGVTDLTAGSYGAPVYFLKGIGGLQFAPPVQLLSDFGSTVMPNPATFYHAMPFGVMGGRIDSYATNAAWMKFDDDDKPDLILGNNNGQLFVWLSREDNMGYAQPGMPVFKRTGLQKNRQPTLSFLDSGGTAPFVEPGPPNEILLNGEPALLNDYHAAPAATDWDGDGLCDLWVGSYSGRVYWLRNTGKPGAPQFQRREVLLEGGRRVQWVNANADVGVGVRSQVQTADYNGDGKLDLLVGYYSESRVSRKNLSRTERKRLENLRTQVVQLDGQVEALKADRSTPEATRAAMKEHSRLALQIGELEKQMIPLLAPVDAKPRALQGTKSHGQVWVYLGQ